MVAPKGVRLVIVVLSQPNIHENSDKLNYSNKRSVTVCNFWMLEPDPTPTSFHQWHVGILLRIFLIFYLLGSILWISDRKSALHTMLTFTASTSVL